MSLGLDTLFDSLTFGLFDADNTYDKPPGSTYTYDQSQDEKDIVSLLSSDLDDISAQNMAQIQARKDEYYSTLMSDSPLSDEESADFDTQYDAELDALTEKYDVDVKRHGASRMAELASRGVLETTTGSDQLAEDQRGYTDAYSGATASLLQEKELAKMDFGDRKKAMAQQGYNLTSGIMQQRRGNALQSASFLQNYATGQRVSKIGTDLSNMMRNQQWNQYTHQQKNDDVATTTGGIMGILDLMK